jgi:hypothetical protein
MRKVINSQRGSAPGLQIFLQRRTANGFSGWISYTYGGTQVRDGVTGSHFAADLTSGIWLMFSAAIASGPP